MSKIHEINICSGVQITMDPRVGQRIIRDRWGEPIAPLPPDPERPKPRGWCLRIFGWLRRKIMNRTRHDK